MSSIHGMSGAGARSGHSVDAFEEIAANWIARRNGHNFSAEEDAELHTWLAADARHARAFAEMDVSWTALNDVRRAGRADVIWADLDARARRRSRRRTLYTFATGGLAAAAVLTFAFVTSKTSSPAVANPSTIALRPDRQTLPDGSTVELNAAAEIVIGYSAERRRVRLVQGEALFSVAKDASRPFVVIAGSVEIRAVGTAFSVRHDPRQIDVVVTEGQVAVERVVELPADTAPAKSDPVYLSAGGKVVVPAILPETTSLEIVPMSAADLSAALAWRHNRIEFTETQLGDAVKLFNRQNRVQLSLVDPALARRSITGIFWADDPDGFVRLLEAGFEIRAKRRGDVVTLRSE